MANTKSKSTKVTINNDTGESFVLSGSRITELCSDLFSTTHKLYQSWRYVSRIELAKAFKASKKVTATNGYPEVRLKHVGESHSGYPVLVVANRGNVQIGCKTFVGKDAKKLATWLRTTARTTKAKSTKKVTKPKSKLKAAA